MKVSRPRTDIEDRTLRDTDSLLRGKEGKSARVIEKMGTKIGENVGGLSKNRQFNKCFFVSPEPSTGAGE